MCLEVVKNITNVQSGQPIPDRDLNPRHLPGKINAMHISCKCKI